MNALLDHLFETGKAFGISHGIENTDQFNNVVFMDDASVFGQDQAGSQILLDSIDEFRGWSNMQLNLGKTVVLDVDSGSGQRDPPKLTFKKVPIKVFPATDSCRHLGFWATANGDMTATQQRVMEKTRATLEVLTHHPLEANMALELFQSVAVSVFRFSAAYVQWTQQELDQLRSLWTRTYKRSEHLCDGTASDIYVFPKTWGGKERSTPDNIIAQALCDNLRRCLVHDDVAKNITTQELQQAKDTFMCSTLDDLNKEMSLWLWNQVSNNRWTRALKACNQIGVQPRWSLEGEEDDDNDDTPFIVLTETKFR
jgi:hypothetical protein